MNTKWKLQNDDVEDLEVLNEVEEEDFPIKYKGYYIDFDKDAGTYNVYSSYDWEQEDAVSVPEAEMPDLEYAKLYVDGMEDVSEFEDDDATDSIEEATNVSSMGQHKRSSIDLIPNLEDEKEEKFSIKEDRDRVNTYVYVSELRKAIEDHKWKKDEYPLFEEQAEYLTDFLEESNFTKTDDVDETVFISPDDTFYVSITKDGKFIRFTNSDDMVNESPNITELNPNLKDTEDSEDVDVDSGTGDLDIPEDEPDDILLEVDLDDETDEEDEYDPEDNPDGEEETEVTDKDLKQLLNDLSDCVNSTSPLEDMEYFILKFYNVNVSLLLAPILYEGMVDEDSPKDVYDKLSKEILAYQK